MYNVPLYMYVVHCTSCIILDYFLCTVIFQFLHAIFAPTCFFPHVRCCSCCCLNKSNCSMRRITSQTQTKNTMTAMISISDQFDSGNISVISIHQSEDITEIELNIKNEPFTNNEQKQHKQWFHFRASGVRNVACKICTDNQTQSN